MDIEIKNIRGYFDRGKIVVNLGCYYGLRLLVSSFIYKDERGWGKGGGFTLLSIMIILVPDITWVTVLPGNKEFASPTRSLKQLDFTFIL